MVLRRHGAVSACVILVVGALSCLPYPTPPRALASPDDIFAQPDAPSDRDADLLFPVKQNGKWGYIDKLGRVIVEPTYDEADMMSDGMAAVVLKGKLGYIDSTGRLAIEPQYQIPPETDDRRFCEGRAWVLTTRASTARGAFLSMPSTTLLSPFATGARPYASTASGVTSIAKASGSPSRSSTLRSASASMTLCSVLWSGLATSTATSIAKVHSSSDPDSTMPTRSPEG